MILEQQAPATQTPGLNTRLYELDGLRVSVFLLLILYHTGMLYVAGWDWHFKSQYQSNTLASLMLWSNQWRMSLLFFISGAALAVFLSRRSGWRPIGKRLTHLVIPLVFGVLVVVVPQVYVEAKFKHVIEHLNYWEFWYAYLDQNSPEFEGHKTLGDMHLTWNHLWYLPYLFVYTSVLSICFPLLRSPALRPLWHWLAKRLGLTSLVLLPISGFYLNGWLLYADNPVTHNLVQDWFNHGRSFLSFILGFALVQLPQLWQRIISIRWHLLVAALLTCGYTLFAFHGGSLGEGLLAQELNGLLWSANTWLWMLCILAWGQRAFSCRSRLIDYLNSGIFCFYILHQTLIILFAYWLAPLELGAFLEPLIVIALVAASGWALFETIKRIPGIGIVFGIRPLVKETSGPEITRENSSHCTKPG